MLIIFALVGLVLVLLSFASWQHPPTLGLRGTSNSYQTARAIFFGFWTLALPAYLLFRWYFVMARHLPTDAPIVANFQYEQQLWVGVWAAVGSVLAFLFGIRK